MKNFLILAGARPNFMKIAPLNAALRERGAQTFIVHTGQHYDHNMSDVFFRELGIPAPDVNLGVGSSDRKTQSKKIIQALVPLLCEKSPDAIIVVGDVTSTAAGAMAGVMAGIPVVHVEAGLRSFNWKMPEELNRMIADHHSDLLFVNEASGVENLKNEAIPDERVHLVGNIMIDTLRRAEPFADKSTILEKHGLKPGEFGLLTMHRPENVDFVDALKSLCGSLSLVSDHVPLIYPLHPRTKARLQEFGLQLDPRIKLIDPVGYFDMLALIKNVKLVLTDSGGLQEETTALSVPCITLREQTERPITVEEGTSEIVGRDRQAILQCVYRIKSGNWKAGKVPELWDGRVAYRIADILLKS
ncbi:MAG: UDP-N-acetylglucosamine 2-epimerase (non-hydrolyzing) [Patescibacteria group bacterium]